MPKYTLGVGSKLEAQLLVANDRWMPVSDARTVDTDAGTITLSNAGLIGQLNGVRVVHTETGEVNPTLGSTTEPATPPPAIVQQPDLPVGVDLDAVQADAQAPTEKP